MRPFRDDFPLKTTDSRARENSEVVVIYPVTGITCPHQAATGIQYWAIGFEVNPKTWSSDIVSNQCVHIMAIHQLHLDLVNIEPQTATNKASPSWIFLWGHDIPRKRLITPVIVVSMYQPCTCCYDILAASGLIRNDNML